MELVTSFFRLGIFALLCFSVVAGFLLLIFAAPWKISLAVLSFILIAGLIYLQRLSSLTTLDSEIISFRQSSDSTAEVFGEKALSYRGVKYVPNPAAPTSSLPQPLDDCGNEEIIGQYRGALVKFPRPKS